MAVSSLKDREEIKTFYRWYSHHVYETLYIPGILTERVNSGMFNENQITIALTNSHISRFLDQDIRYAEHWLSAIPHLYQLRMHDLL